MYDVPYEDKNFRSALCRSFPQLCLFSSQLSAFHFGTDAFVNLAIDETMTRDKEPDKEK